MQFNREHHPPTHTATGATAAGGRPQTEGVAFGGKLLCRLWISRFPGWAAGRGSHQSDWFTAGFRLFSKPLWVVMPSLTGVLVFQKTLTLVRENFYRFVCFNPVQEQF